MRYISLIISLITLAFGVSECQAQQQLRHITYYSYDYDSDHTDTTKTFVDQIGTQIKVFNDAPAKGNLIPGYAEELTYADYHSDSIFFQYHYLDNHDLFYVASTMKRSDIKWDTQVVDSKTTRYVTSINSNRIELLFSTKEGFNANPLPYYGKFDGVLQQMVRNGLVQIELNAITKEKRKAKQIIPDNLGTRKSSREMSNLKRDRMVLTTHVFENEQICWGKEKPTLTDIPYDTTLHFAGGTLILKRIKLPKLPSHYQTFIELRQRSNGDAYDRTGSVFIIPRAGETGVQTFLDGILYHPDSLPIVEGSDGQRYQGIVQQLSNMHKYKSAPSAFSPIVELMRFFTPFGVGKFNDRVHIDGLKWEDETFYKQEVTDLKPLLEGDVFIGVFIGNYDGGGHKVSLDIKSYPNDYEWEIAEEEESSVVSLVNTCNVLEMAGQNYGKIFGTDSITVDFYTEGDEKEITLRYISTGHGGWGGGDEFNPKENVIIIDGEKRFSHTPWRCDCARYREWNPVSGNFWNGISSSDLSRSGWCPGIATQPVYFDLSDLEPGTHTLTIAIPQGKPMEGGFSHWNVSAALIINYK
ncbi:MAG: glpgli family protein [Bacteroidales bacterium]|nr:glpgli family protein [Bacteroidales bacterium]